MSILHLKKVKALNSFLSLFYVFFFFVVFLDVITIYVITNVLLYNVIPNPPILVTVNFTFFKKYNRL